MDNKIKVGWFSFSCCEASTIIFTELILADLETVNKRLEKSSREARTDKVSAAQLPILEKFKTTLESDTILSKLELTEDQQALAHELNLLTSKKFVYVVNVSEQQLTEKWQPDQALLDIFVRGGYIVEVTHQLFVKLGVVYLNFV